MICRQIVVATLSIAAFTSNVAHAQGNAGRINAAVCAMHSMPHAELQFKEFWTKNTGIVYLPGLLVASQGYNSC